MGMGKYESMYWLSCYDDEVFRRTFKKFNADFIITGEVLNQRPMSQNKAALNVVKKNQDMKKNIKTVVC